MLLNQNLVEGLTPGFLPPDSDTLEGEVSTIVQVAEGSSYRRLLWGKFINDLLIVPITLIASMIKGSWYTGVGLVPWKGTEIHFDEVNDQIKESANESGYVWGGVIFTSEPGPPFSIDEYNELSFQGNKFPIIVCHATQEQQAMEVHDQHGLLGTVACWAKANSRNTNFPNISGSLTAAHTIGSNNRQLEVKAKNLLIPVKAGSVWSAPPCIDVAFLETPWSSPNKNPLPIISPQSIAKGDPVVFDGAASGSVSGYVTHTSAHSAYKGSGIPMLLCHTGLGSNGDSGSLVEVNGSAACMHLGKINLDSGGQESRTLFLSQAQHLLEIDLYS